MLEPLIVFDRVLAADPAKAYARMDFQPAANSIATRWPQFAERSDCSELEIAQLALRTGAGFAQSSGTRDPRLALAQSHVGYYLIGEGAEQLRARAGVRLARGASACRHFLRRHPDEFYLGGIEILTLLIVIAIMTPVFNSFQQLSGHASSPFSCLLLPAARARSR